MAGLTTGARGVFIISVTPFLDDGTIDFDGIDHLINFYRSHDVDGITILGMMGEATKLTVQEQKSFAGAMLDAVGGEIPVIVGVSAPGFASMGDIADHVMVKGASAVMIAPPSGLKGDPAVKRYFDDAVASIGSLTPFVIQDFPLATGVAVSADLIQEIAEKHENCVMLKHEDWPGLDKISRLRALHGAGRRHISITTGNGGIFLPDEMARGADGAMTGFAYPELLVSVCRLMDAGDVDRAHDLFDAYLPLIRYEQQPGIGLPARKYVLQKRGAIKTAHARRPVPLLSETSKAELDLLMTRLEKRLLELG